MTIFDSVEADVEPQWTFGVACVQRPPRKEHRSNPLACNDWTMVTKVVNGCKPLRKQDVVRVRGRSAMAASSQGGLPNSASALPWCA